MTASAREADSLEDAGESRVQRDDDAELVEGGDALDEVPDVLLAQLEGQRVGVGLGEAQGGHHLGEVAVGGGADHQLELVGAVLVAGGAAAEPGAFAGAGEREDGGGAEGARGGVAVDALDDDAGHVAGRVLEQVELGAVADLVLVGEEDPGEVAEVAVLAGGDEPDGDGVGPLAAVAGVAVAVVLRFEAVGGAGEAAAALAHEPPRELEGAHADLLGRFAGVAGGGEAEVLVGGEVEVGVEGFETGDEGAAEAGVVDGVDLAGLVAPVLEAADDDGAVDEVDHRAGAVHRDHLALADLSVGAEDSVGARLSLGVGHQRLSSSWAKRSQTCVLGSTSRMEVGATNRRSS